MYEWEVWKFLWMDLYSRQPMTSKTRHHGSGQTTRKCFGSKRRLNSTDQTAARYSLTVHCGRIWTVAKHFWVHSSVKKARFDWTSFNYSFLFDLINTLLFLLFVSLMCFSSFFLFQMCSYCLSVVMFKYTCKCFSLSILADQCWFIVHRSMNSTDGNC